MPSGVSFGIENPRPGCVVASWKGVSSNVECVPFFLNDRWGLLAHVQCSGSFSGGSAAMLSSNDGESFIPLYDNFGGTVSFSENGGAEISTAALMVKPIVNGDAEVDFIVAFRLS